MCLFKKPSGLVNLKIKNNVDVTIVDKKNSSNLKANVATNVATNVAANMETNVAANMKTNASTTNEPKKYVHVTGNVKRLAIQK